MEQARSVPNLLVITRACHYLEFEVNGRRAGIYWILFGPVIIRGLSLFGEVISFSVSDRAKLTVVVSEVPSGEFHAATPTIQAKWGGGSFMTHNVGGGLHDALEISVIKARIHYTEGGTSCWLEEESWESALFGGDSMAYNVGRGNFMRRDVQTQPRYRGSDCGIGWIVSFPASCGSTRSA